MKSTFTFVSVSGSDDPGFENAWLFKTSEIGFVWLSCNRFPFRVKFSYTYTVVNVPKFSL